MAKTIFESKIEKMIPIFLSVFFFFNLMALSFASTVKG